MESETKSLKPWNGKANELLSKIEDDEIIIADDLNSITNNTKFDEMSTVSRRSDEPSELSFEKGKYNKNVFLHIIRFNVSLRIWTKKNCYLLVPETYEEQAKRKLIEEALCDENTKLEVWQEFATSEYGLINGK